MSSSPRLSARLQEKLYESVSQQPVTIVIGPTGCGKSTLVPSFLVDRLNKGPVLCTQPRRLAVVAVATRVAQEARVELGGKEVGYHVGAANHTLRNTQLVYTTAGILLEELRCQGAVAALSRYKCIIIDECHERSPESDLVLALIRNVFANKRKYPMAFVRNLRLVLMSATFDHDRYHKYFQDVVPRSEGSAKIGIINLETADSYDAFYERVETHYLDSVLPLLPDKKRHASLQTQMKVNPDEALLTGHDGGKTLPEALLHLIQSLVEYLDHKETPSSGVFLIFAPTYRQLEQIYERLHHHSKRGASTTAGEGSSEWKIGVLHSSVDMEFCLRNMMEATTTNGSNWNNKRVRKILLASAVADSSVTVPGVTVVIDLCRSLSVKWDASKRQHVPKTVWSSKSICNQRRGRTGRTCAGNVYRLVPKRFFLERLQDWEEPQLAISSCRNEILKLLCTAKQNNHDSDKNDGPSSKIMPTAAPDPTSFLQQCLDPPPHHVTSQAMDYLVQILACVETTSGVNAISRRQRQPQRMWAPTRYGELLASLPFQVQESTILIKGGQLGILHEVLTMQAIRSHKPAPIAHHFAKEYANEEAMSAFYPNVNVKNTTSIDMANFAAFVFWDTQWNGVHRARATKAQFSICTGYSFDYHTDVLSFCNGEAGNPETSACCDVWKWTPSLEEKHIAWCEQHGINPTAVRGIAELLESTWNILFHSDFEPEWLRCTEPTPLWRRQSDWKGVDGENDILGKVYGARRVDRLYNALVTLSQNPLDATLESTGLDYFYGETSRSAMSGQSHQRGAPKEPLACVFFLQGSCSYGSRCRNSHSPFARRPHCKFYKESGFCARGENCVFSHSADDDEQQRLAKRSAVSIVTDPLKAMAPLQPGFFVESTADWFLEHGDRLLLLGEGNFEFTRALIGMHRAPFAASMKRGVGEFEEGDDITSIGGTLIFDVDATTIHTNANIVQLVDEGDIDSFAWNFPFTGLEEDVESHESLILGTLYSLKLLADRSRQSSRFAISLQGDQFARWNVLRSCHRTGWLLAAWGVFDSKDYPSYYPRRENGSRFPATNARFYVLETLRSA
jgi:HrpA-like RNA helicase